jgi:hypothetical protein
MAEILTPEKASRELPEFANCNFLTARLRRNGTQTGYKPDFSVTQEWWKARNRKNFPVLFTVKSEEREKPAGRR